jgi:ubiquinone/menaquinone biosynthesis C-methylase UbiE
MDLDADIAAHYVQGVERNRLTTWGRLEAERTRELMARFLLPPPAVILDVGGAEGAYALPLARAGYEVHLIDPVSTHVEAARSASARQAMAPLASAEIGDARALPADDGAVDVVLMLGPLYHLIDAHDRAKALLEAHRVLRSGGLLLAAGISRFASTLDGLRTGAITDATFESIVQNDLRTGVHRNPDIQGRPEWFTLAYFHTPDELREEVRHSGFPDADVFAVEGPCASATINSDLDDPAARAAILRAIERVEREPSLLGASPHLLVAATKP